MLGVHAALQADFPHETALESRSSYHHLLKLGFFAQRPEYAEHSIFGGMGKKPQAANTTARA
jgi:hypothetical protein